MLNAINTFFFFSGISWPKAHDDVVRFIKSCATCQKIADKSRVKHGRYGSTESHAPFEVVAIDTLYVSKADPYAKNLFVMIDTFTRWVELVPTIDKKGSSAAEAFLTSWIARYGAPKVILSDQGKEFENSFFEVLKTPFGINSRTTFGYHPEGNSICERVNQEVLRALKGIVQPLALQEQWASAVPMVQYQLNTSQHRSLGTSPFALVFGRINQAPLPGLEEVGARLKDIVHLGDMSTRQYADRARWVDQDRLRGSGRASGRRSREAPAGAEPRSS